MSEQEGFGEPPIHIEPEGVKPELRRSGHRWLDLTIALTAIVLSLISLVVAINNARTQEKMVAAATWPLLQFGTTNVSEGQRVIRLTVSNTGVGPARVRTAAIFYRGREVKRWPDMLSACCGLTPAATHEADGGGYASNRLAQIIIRPGEEVDILEVRRTDANAAIWDRLDEERFKLKFGACYCSVFDECWRSNLESLDPRRVKRCEAPGEGGGG